MTQSSRTQGKTIIAFVILLDLMDEYELSYKSNLYIVHLKISKYENTISGSNLMVLLKLVGDWLVTLPKTVWKNKELNKTRYENTIQR